MSFFPISGGRVTLRKPTVADGRVIWELVSNSGVLDLNSPYSYLILCKHFADTCLLAEQGGQVVGFVTAYRPPVSPEVVFVWQVGVAESLRGQGLGSTLLYSLLDTEACRDASFLEATVTPSNTASLRLFQSLARRLEAGFREEPCFREEHFGGVAHEPEHLVRIGPFHSSNLHRKERNSENDRTS